MGKRIIWTQQAVSELYEAFLSLYKQSKSIEISKRITTEIYNSTSDLAFNPEMYKIDSLKLNNRGTIRAYEKHTYRISYMIDQNSIYILRVRYARKEPLTF